jgi:hypothetical protein
VILRDIGQSVRGFDLENAKDIHGRIVPPAGCRCNSPNAGFGCLSRSWS